MTQVHSPMLSFAEARQEACLTCRGSPCCRHLNLQTFDLETVADLDYALYLLNFEGIYLSPVRDMRTAQVFLHQDCRQLDSEGLCSVHSTPAQPAICVEYRSHDCSYRRAFLDEVSDEQPLIDREQMQWFVEQLTFDDDRRIVGRPFWPDVVAGFRRLSKPRPAARAGGGHGLIQIGVATSSGPHRFTDPGIAQPCESCPAWCCRSLVFPRQPPWSARELEFLRYCLGFPSVELKMSDEGWAVVVSTTCRHHVDGRCGVYGTDERPIRCRDYDEFNCEYKTHFSAAPPSASVRIGPEDFHLVANLMVFDQMGRVRSIPPVSAVKQALHRPHD